jgi:hypothetical protein
VSRTILGRLTYASLSCGIWDIAPLSGGGYLFHLSSPKRWRNILLSRNNILNRCPWSWVNNVKCISPIQRFFDFYLVSVDSSISGHNYSSFLDGNAFATSSHFFMMMTAPTIRAGCFLTFISPPQEFDIIKISAGRNLGNSIKFPYFETVPH